MDVIMSIKKEYCELIKSREKVYEFRPRLPKRLPVKHIYVYEMLPTSAIKYILKVGKPIELPEQIAQLDSYGVPEFNLGEGKNKVAYPILSMKELEFPIHKDELLEEYNLVPPQSYVYIDTYRELEKKIIKCNKIKLF